MLTGGICADQPVLSVTKPPTENKGRDGSLATVTSVLTLFPALPASMDFPPFDVLMCPSCCLVGWPGVSPHMRLMAVGWTPYRNLFPVAG